MGYNSKYNGSELESILDKANELDSLFQLSEGNGTYNIGTPENPIDTVYCRGVFELSDEKSKTIIGDVNITCQDIADAPAVEYRFKGCENSLAGTLAQYWENILPSVVSKGDIITLDYSSLGVINSIILAREVCELRRELEKIKDNITNYNKNSSHESN